MSLTYRVDKCVLEPQLAKTLRGALLSKNLTSFLEDALAYYIYDFHFVRYGENIQKFTQVKITSGSDKVMRIEPNEEFLIVCLGNDEKYYRNDAYDLNWNRAQEEEEAFPQRNTESIQLGGTIKGKNGKDPVELELVHALAIQYRTEENTSLDDWPVIGSLGYLISKPSGTNHLTTVT